MFITNNVFTVLEMYSQLLLSQRILQKTLVNIRYTFFPKGGKRLGGGDSSCNSVGKIQGSPICTCCIGNIIGSWLLGADVLSDRQWSRRAEWNLFFGMLFDLLAEPKHNSKRNRNKIRW